MDKVDKIMTGFTRVFARKVENQASVESPCLAQPAEAVPPSSTVAGEVERQLASALPAFRTILRKELKQSRIDSKKDEESSLLEQVHSLQIEYRQLEETNSALQDENQELQRRLADVGTGQNRQPGFPRLSEEVRSLQLENRKLGEESKELRDERNDMREEIKNLKRRVVELEDVVKMPLNQPLGHPKRNRSSDDHDGGQESTSEKPEWALGTKTSKQKSKAVEAGQDKSKSDDVLDSGTMSFAISYLLRRVSALYSSSTNTLLTRYRLWQQCS
jgi:FtsZ-binding cell division protein ZapB